MTTRTIITALLLTASLQATAKATDLTGKWKETARRNTRGESIPFTDTLRIEFLTGNEYTRSRPMGFLYRGTYKLTDKALDLGSLYFTVKEIKYQTLLLSDEQGTYELTRYSEEPYTGNNRAKKKDEVVSGDMPLVLSDYAGTWQVFKRTSNSTLDKIDYDFILRSVEFYTLPKGDTLGAAAAAKDMQGRPSWYIKRYNNGMLFCEGKSSRSIKILQAAERELILEENGITYFMKRF